MHMLQLSRLAIVCLLLLPVTVIAQFNSITNDVSLEIQPRFPEANTTVTVSINDFALGSGSGIIQWFIDGEEQTALANARAIQVPVGAIGVATQVQASLTLATGQTISVSETITPAAVAVVLEPQTSAPHWYIGRTLPSVGSTVRAVALPDLGESQPATNYTYTWQLNATVLNGGPVFGQNSVVFTMPFGDRAVLTVTVASREGDILTQRSVVVPNFEPELLFYTNNPLLGQSRLAQPDSFQLLGFETTIQAEPYHLARTVSVENSVFEWKVNNRTVTNPNADPYSITLRNEGGTGRFAVDFHVRNLDQLLQGARGSFNVGF